MAKKKQPTTPLMPMATAVWLVDNTALTFEQIAVFCGLHLLEVQSIADGDLAVGIKGHDPITSGQLTQDEITRCEGDDKARLEMLVPDVIAKRLDGTRYTPLNKRVNKPDGIAWIVKNYPLIPDAKIVKLIGTTKTTINSIREKTHRNMSTIRARDPVALGLCSQRDLNLLIEKYCPAEEVEDTSASIAPSSDVDISVE